jgi:hypothetical protein
LTRFVDEISKALEHTLLLDNFDENSFINILQLLHSRYDGITESIIESISSEAIIDAREGRIQNRKNNSLIAILCKLYNKGVVWEFADIASVVSSTLLKLSTDQQCIDLNTLIDLISNANVICRGIKKLFHVSEVLEHENKVSVYERVTPCKMKRVEDDIIETLELAVQIWKQKYKERTQGNSMFTSLPNDHPLNKLKTCILHLALLVQSRDDSKATNICDALHKVEEEAKEIIHKRETELASESIWENEEEEAFFCAEVQLPIMAMGGIDTKQNIDVAVALHADSLLSIFETQNIKSFDSSLKRFGRYILSYRKKDFIKELASFSDIRLRLVPYYCRAIAVCSKYDSDIAISFMRTALKKIVSYVERKGRQYTYCTMVCSKYLAVLYKFGNCPPEHIFCLLNMCIKDFFGLKICLCCSLISECGFHMNECAETKTQFRLILDTVIRLRHAKNLGYSSNTLIDSACHGLLKEETYIRSDSESSLFSFVQNLIFFTETNNLQHHISRLPWTLYPSVGNYMIKAFLNSKGGSGEHMRSFLKVTSRLDKKYHQRLIFQLKDEIFEELSTCIHRNKATELQKIVFLAQFVRWMLTSGNLSLAMLFAYIQHQVQDLAREKIFSTEICGSGRKQIESTFSSRANNLSIFLKSSLKHQLSRPVTAKLVNSYTKELVNEFLACPQINKLDTSSKTRLLQFMCSNCFHGIYRDVETIVCEEGNLFV